MLRSTRRSGKAPAVAAGLAMFLALTAWCSLAIVGQSFAQGPFGEGGYFLDGDATLVEGNASPTGARATNTGPDPGIGYGPFGSVHFAIPAGLKVSQLTHLSTDYKFVLGSCEPGSPRFTANVTNGTSSGSIFFYIGPPCPSAAYTNSGNLAAPTSLVDASNLGGSLNQRFSDVKADFGDYTVTAVHLDVDGPNAGFQTVDFDNTRVNANFVTYEPPPPPPPAEGLVPVHGVELLAAPVDGTV